MDKIVSAPEDAGFDHMPFRFAHRAFQTQQQPIVEMPQVTVDRDKRDGSLAQRVLTKTAC
jgi:hypothetical protein